MNQKPSLVARFLNFFTFAQKFIAICVLFALAIGSLAVLQIRNELDKLNVIDVELLGVTYFRPIQQLMENLVEHQQTWQRYKLGDRSLDSILGYQQQRINDIFHELVERDTQVADQLGALQDTGLRLADRTPPASIQTKWEDLVKKVPDLTKEDSEKAHIKLLDELIDLTNFLRQATTLLPDNDLASQHLVQLLYVTAPQLQKYLMQLVNVGEIVAANQKIEQPQRDALIESMALVNFLSQGIDETTWGAIHARDTAAGDLALKAALEGPLAELLSAVNNLTLYVREKLLNAENANAGLGTFVATATIGINESFQFSNALSEGLERLLHLRREEMLFSLQVKAAVIALIAFLAFFFSLVFFRAMFFPLKDLVLAAEQLAKGNLTVRVPVFISDEIAEVGRAFNHMAGSIEEILKQLKSAGVQLTTSTTQMAAAAKQQEATIVQQETTTKQIAVTAKEISVTATEFAGTIHEVTRGSEEASSLAASGKTALEQLAKIMQTMVEAATEITGKLTTLNEKMGTITGVITTITKVADRTNLLSLNAAIEAHKIGEKGGGFGVIATEIRRLADQTAFATLDIEKAVNEMVATVSTSVEGVMQFSENIRKGVGQSNNIGELLTRIIAQVQQQTSSFEIVNQGMEAQSVGAKQITDSIEELSEVAQQSTTSVKQFHLALNQLSTAIKDLQNTVSRLQHEERFPHMSTQLQESST